MSDRAWSSASRYVAFCLLTNLAGGCANVAQCLGLRPGPMVASPPNGRVALEGKLDSTLRRIVVAYRDADVADGRKRLTDGHDLGSDDSVAVIVRIRNQTAGAAAARLSAMRCEVIFAGTDRLAVRVPGALVEPVAELSWVVSMSTDRAGQFVPLDH
jgi:hypothetical protein